MTEASVESAPVLRLADGSSWRIVAGEPEAVPVVATLAAIMRLSWEAAVDRPSTGYAMPPRELRVIVRDGPEARAALQTDGDGPVVVAVFPSADRAMHTIAVTRTADAIARDAAHRGGLLVHGALAEFEGRGVVLAGAGTTGKSTASRRLPAPWRSWSDDATLIVRDPTGRLRAHPWPTWSRFYERSGEGSWDVTASLPLDALCFLAQAETDTATPTSHGAQAVAMLMDCVAAVSLGMRRDLDDTQAGTLFNEQLANVEACVAEIPTYNLELSLTGSFWTLLEPLLGKAHGGATADGRRMLGRDVERQVVALHGTSMLPTLREPALLEVAHPDGSPLRVGDIAYFRSPANNVMVVHRIISIRPEGIRTRGDNSSTPDPYVLRPSEVLGRVVALRRGERRRPVAGGDAGRALAGVARIRRAADRTVSPRLHSAYCGLARTGTCRALWSRLAPRTLQPRVVRFGDGLLATHKLLLAGYEIGSYDLRRRHWTIRRPFRLIVNKKALPGSCT